MKWLSVLGNGIWKDSQKFYHENLPSRQNDMNYKSFTPQKFGAIWYYVMYAYDIVHLFCCLYRMSWGRLVGPHCSVIIHKAYRVMKKIWKTVYHAGSALSNGRSTTSHFTSPQTNWCVRCNDCMTKLCVLLE